MDICGQMYNLCASFTVKRPEEIGGFHFHFFLAAKPWLKGGGAQSGFLFNDTVVQATISYLVVPIIYLQHVLHS